MFIIWITMLSHKCIDNIIKVLITSKSVLIEIIESILIFLSCKKKEKDKLLWNIFMAII